MIRVYFGNGNYDDLPYDQALWTDANNELAAMARRYGLYDLESTMPLSNSGLWAWWHSLGA